MFIFFCIRGVDEVAGDHHKLRPRVQAIQFDDAAVQRSRGVDFSVGKFAWLLDMQIGNLRDENGRPHGLSGNSRIAEGSIASPTRSPTFTTGMFGTSAMIGRSATPPIVNRWRSPTKLTPVTSPTRVAPSGATMRIDSGRIIAWVRPAVA